MDMNIYIFVYLFIINVFAIYETITYFRIDLVRANGVGNPRKKKAISLISMLGGTYGKYLATLKCDRKRMKDKPLETVFDLCLISVQLYTVTLIIKLKDFTIKHTWIEVERELLQVGMICAIASFISFIVYMVLAAGESEITKKKKFIFIGFAVIGGGAGELLAIVVSRTREKIGWLWEGIKMIFYTEIIILFLLTVIFIFK